MKAIWPKLSRADAPYRSRSVERDNSNTGIWFFSHNILFYEGKVLISEMQLLEKWNAEKYNFVTTTDDQVLLAAQTKKVQPALVFPPLRGQDQNILPVFGPGLVTCLLLALLPHTHSGGVESGWGLLGSSNLARLLCTGALVIVTPFWSGVSNSLLDPGVFITNFALLGVVFVKWGLE